MPTLEPVDYDPFARLTPVDYDPWDGRPMPSTYEESRMDAAQRRLEPVDHDPFSSAPAPSSRAQEKFNKIADAVAAGAKNWIETPGRAMREGITTDQAVDWAAPTAMGMLGVGAPNAMSGAAGIFGGKLAQTADLAKLAKAEEMAAKGHYPDDIWTQTGWFKGADDKWRFEIPDNGSTIKGTGPKDGPLQDVFFHPELHRAYPDIAKTATEIGVHGEPGYRAQYQRAESGFPEKFTVFEGAPNRRSSLLHEIQHSIQERENFGRGSNPLDPEVSKIARAERDSVRSAATQKFEEMSAAREQWLDQYAKDNGIDLTKGADYQRANKAHNDLFRESEQERDRLFNVMTATMPDRSGIYRRFAGEVEARNVQHRADWDAQKRTDIPPEFSQDMPTAEQIVRVEDKQ